MYRRIVEAVPQGIWVVDLEGRTIFSNHRMAALLGVDFEAMSTASCFACVFEADLADAQSRFANGLGGDARPFDFRLRRADGSPIWVSISCMPICDDGGALTGLLGLFSDISERKQAEVALVESEERFRNMADTAPVMIWVTGPDTLATFFSRRWLEFRGRSMEQELGLEWLEGIHPEDRDPCMAIYASAFETLSGFQTEKRMRRADGEYRSLLCTGVPRFSENGAFSGYVGSSIDITDLRRTQEQTLAAQKLESLGVLSRGIAHDFNNFLGSILANSELALDDLPRDSPARQGVVEIQAVAVRAAEIVRELMAYAGQENAVVEPIDISKLVAEMLELLKISISKRATLKIDLGNRLPFVRANAAQMRQVVMNLITNASEALGERDGEITVTLARARCGPDPGASSLAEEDFLRLEVADTGCGMTEEIQARIFDPFFTTKFAGRGLGLAAVQGVIRSHGGAINVTSAPGRGSRFEILLRCCEDPGEDGHGQKAAPLAGKIKSLDVTVLVVEDEDTLRIAVSKMLRREGAAVIEAANGRAAVDLMRTRAPEIDVVLLDMTLPGISGPEVLTELRRMQPGLQVIITSAYSQAWALNAIGEQEPWLYIRKPYPFRELRALLQKVSLDDPKISGRKLPAPVALP